MFSFKEEGMLESRLRKVSGRRSRRIFHMDRKFNIASPFLVMCILTA